MSDNKAFEDVVLDGVSAIRQRQDALTTDISRLTSETKTALEELTKVKNQLGDQAEFTAKLRRFELELARERRMAWGDPRKKLLSNPDHVKILSAIGRGNMDGLKGVSPEVIGKVLYTGATPGSTYIVSDLANEIYDVLASYGKWSTLQVLNVGTKTTTLPVTTARPIALAITAETTQVTEDATRAGTSVSLGVIPLACLLHVSSVAIEDSEFDIASMLLDDFAEAFNYRLDWMCFSADGTSDTTDGGMTGIASGGTAAAAGSGNTTIATLELEDFVRCLTTVASGVLSRPCKWWIHPQVLAKVIQIRDSNGRPIFQTALEAPAPGGVGSILGYPVVLADAMPSTDSAGKVVAVFGDPRGGVVGIRTQFQFDFTDAFKYDYLQRSFRGYGRAGFIIRAATAFAMLTTAAS